jgi:recombination protein RecR
MSVIDEVTRELARLPGIGPRTATRLAFHLIRVPREEAFRLAGSIRAMAERVRPCGRCGNFTELEVCEICADTSRDRGTLCVVETPFEVLSIDRTGQYRGLFHVLGGRLSPLDGVGPEDLNVATLLQRVQGEGEDGVHEVILATNPSVEGEATAVYLETELRPLGVRVTRLARGIPVGSDLEYVDGSTLAEALAGRRER